MGEGIDGLRWGKPCRNLVHLTVRSRADTFAAAVMIRRMVESTGGTRRDAAAVSVAAAELAQNIVTHGGGHGELLAWRAHDVVVIQAMDRGPGAPSPDRLFADRRNEATVRFGSLGEGCGAVRRLMDRVRARERDDGGLEVIAYKRIVRGGSDAS